MTAGTRPSTVRRLAAFVWQRFSPPVAVTYGVAWTLAVEGSLVAQEGAVWRPTWASAVRVAGVVATLLFLRMLDEQKDLDYDRRHHPDRPLVTGAIGSGELRAAMAVLAAAALALDLLVSSRSALVHVTVFEYGLVLVVAERASARVRDDLLVNLAVTYPVQLVLAAFVVVSVAAVPGPPPATSAVLLTLAIVTGAFLHFEFARKTRRHAAPGERLYSAALGPRGSAAVTVAWAALACAAALVAFHPWAGGWTGWLPATAAGAAAAGLARFARTGRWPDPAAGAAVLLVLGSVVVRAAVGA